MLRLLNPFDILVQVTMAKILILVNGHLCNLPRTQKEAEILANAGHNVTVAGCWSDPELVQRDKLILSEKKWKFIPVVDIQPSNKWQSLIIRGRTRIAKELFKKLGIFSPELLGYGVKKLLKFAQAFCADITIVHCEAALWVGDKLLDEGFRVGVDFEDWYSEDLLPEARKLRPISKLKDLEKRLLRDCKYCLTTSHVMAQALSQYYEAPIPEVIYNAFPFQERKNIDNKNIDRRNLELPSLHWFSQTIGKGRGLETLFQALSYIENPLEIHLRGNCSDESKTWINTLVPTEWKDLVFIHPTVPNANLLSRIAEHDIGLALETGFCLSRKYTITNKMFQYLQGGLAIVATNTPGQQEIFNHQQTIGKLVETHPKCLAEALNDLLSNPNKLLQAKIGALQLAENQLDWEVQSFKILTRLEEALILNS